MSTDFYPTVLSPFDMCALCGRYVPEGQTVCSLCLKRWDSKNNIKNNLKMLDKSR